MHYIQGHCTLGVLFQKVQQVGDTKDHGILTSRHIIIRLSQQELREIFNAMEVAKKGREGFLIRRAVWHGNRRPKHLPVGSLSTTWYYYVASNNWPLAMTHTYILRGGTPVGEPDPKEIRIDEVVLRPFSSSHAGGA
jgi:hypothetical protein